MIIGSKLSEILLEGSSDEEKYAFSCREDIWSIDEFPALAVGLTPEKYRLLFSLKDKCRSKKILKKLSLGSTIAIKFYAFAEKGLKEEALFCNGVLYYPSSKYIKWCALNEVKLSKRFVQNLPINLFELLLEFQPENMVLQFGSKLSSEYHKAFYKRCAAELLKNRHYEIRDLYGNPKMYQAREHIRKLRGKNYGERTLKSWLSELFENEKGRPKKVKENS